MRRQGRGKKRSAGWSYHYHDGCRTAGQQRLFGNVDLARPFIVSSVVCRATLANSRDAESRKSCNGFATSLDHLCLASSLLPAAVSLLTYGIADVNDNLRQDTIDCDRYPYKPAAGRWSCHHGGRRRLKEDDVESQAACDLQNSGFFYQTLSAILACRTELVACSFKPSCTSSSA